MYSIKSNVVEYENCDENVVKFMKYCWRWKTNDDEYKFDKWVSHLKNNRLKQMNEWAYLWSLTNDGNKIDRCDRDIYKKKSCQLV